MSDQHDLRLTLPPRPETVGLLMQVFGDPLIPVETVRSHYFRNLNPETFAGALESRLIALPITTLDLSTKALRYIDIRHLAAYIDSRSYIADEASHRKIEAATTRPTTPETTA